MDDSGLYLNVDCIQRAYDYNSHELVLEQSGSSGVEHYVAGSLAIALDRVNEKVSFGII